MDIDFDLLQKMKNNLPLLPRGPEASGRSVKWNMTNVDPESKTRTGLLVRSGGSGAPGGGLGLRWRRARRGRISSLCCDAARSFPQRFEHIPNLLNSIRGAKMEHQRRVTEAVVSL